VEGIVPEQPQIQPKGVDFYFDFISPFGFLASLAIDDIAARQGRECRWRPMLLGISVMKVMGVKPLGDTPMKGPYLSNQLRRHGRKLGLHPARPLVGAPGCNSLLASRAFYWLNPRDGALAKEFARGTLAAYWRKAEDIGTINVISDVLASVGGDPEPLLQGIASGEASALCRAAVDESIEKGVFGSPFIHADGEPFFGYDNLAEMEEWLSRGGW
jgi:2-hydroxychromene-2-carboxylate isomerase